MPADQIYHCPVCGARFCQRAECRRCGADLGPLMAVLAQAWSLRQRCRQALARGESWRALELALAADDAHRTAASQRLLRMARSGAAEAAGRREPFV